jgi:hypothetical protein
MKALRLTLSRPASGHMFDGINFNISKAILNQIEALV